MKYVNIKKQSVCLFSASSWHAPLAEILHIAAGHENRYAATKLLLNQNKILLPRTSRMGDAFHWRLVR
ncbi:unnamed protein product [Amaranthus hypochondriacus]